MAQDVTSIALYSCVSNKKEDFVLGKEVGNAAGDQFVHIKLFLADRITKYWQVVTSGCLCQWDSCIAKTHVCVPALFTGTGNACP